MTVGIFQQQFKGTLIITDPCYILNNEDYKKTNYGKNLNELGFTSFLVSDTGYGDWHNEIRRCSPYESFGEFCADSGQVCVVLKDDIEKNPACAKMFSILPEDYYATVEDFEGVVTISTMNPNWTMIYGEGNIEFISKSQEEYFDEDDESKSILDNVNDEW